MYRAMLVVAFALFLSGCGEPAINHQQEQWTIASRLARCGFMEQTGCLLRQEEGYAHSIFGGVIGLDWRWGTTYRVTVETRDVDYLYGEKLEFSTLTQPPPFEHHLIAIHSEHEDEVGTRYAYPNIELSYGVFYRHEAVSYFLAYEYQCALQTQDECDFIHELEETGVEAHLDLVIEYRGNGKIALVEASFIDQPMWW